MMRKFGFLIFILAMLFLPQVTLGLGLMTEPIIIENALRGGNIHQEIIAVNTENKQITVEFTADGQIKDWVKFYKPSDLENPQSATTIEARKSLTMTAVFSVPQDTPNGEYTGIVSVIRKADESGQQEGSSTSIAQKIDREVTIKVSDTETISLEASVIPKTYDLKSGEALKVRIIYDNQSNVSLKPSIGFKIMTNEKTFSNAIYPYPDGEPAVSPNQIHEIPALEIPTTSIADGKYLAQLQFMLGDKVVLEKEFRFSIGLQSSPIINFLKTNSKFIIWPIALAVLLVVAWLIIKNKKNLKKLL